MPPSAMSRSSRSPTLSNLLTPVNALAAELKAVGASVKSGKPDTSLINSANGDLTSLSGLASGFVDSNIGTLRRPAPERRIEPARPLTLFHR